MQICVYMYVICKSMCESVIARCGQGRGGRREEIALDSGRLLAGFALVGCMKPVRDVAGLGLLAAESCTAAQARRYL